MVFLGAILGAWVGASKPIMTDPSLKECVDAPFVLVVALTFGGRSCVNGDKAFHIQRGACLTRCRYAHRV